MRSSMTGIAALVAATALSMSLFIPSADAACKSARCVKQNTASAVASARPMALSKFSKRKHHASARVKNKTVQKTAHAKRSAKIADAASRGRHGASALPPSIANARAELTPRDPKSASGEQDKNLAALDDNDVATLNGVQIAAASQFNDIDRAVSDEKTETTTEESKADNAITEPSASPAQTLSPAPLASPPGRIVKAVPTGEQQVLAKHDDETWSKTSLIGKIFVALGTLLTLASAARLTFA